MLAFRHFTGPVALLLVLLGSPATWAEAIDGTFLAVRGCPAYVSKNKLTNPSHSRVIPGQQYRVIERNRPDAPDYYRIRLDTANPKERWVGSDCGKFSTSTSSSLGPTPPQLSPLSSEGSGAHCPAPAPGASQCETCGRGDSYILALSWQPAFCETQRNELNNKPECRITDPSAFQARNFTLHGLWPNQTACGTHYGFCGSVHNQAKPFTGYPAVPLKADTRNSLGEVMPSVAAGSGLERHEWHKHGTCSGFLPDEYFNIAADLTRQFNQSGMAAYIDANIGRKITKQEFFAQVDRALGTGARDLMGIECSNDKKMLVGITVRLPSGVKPGADLKALLQQARPGAPGTNCGANFLIDSIGF